MAQHTLVESVAEANADVEQVRAAERLRVLVALGEATRMTSDPRAVMAVTTRLLGSHLAATRCAYADVHPGGESFMIRYDWTVPTAASTVGTYRFEPFGPRAIAAMRAGLTLVLYDAERELVPEEAASFLAMGIRAVVCCPLVKEGRLVAMMAVHQSAPRRWSLNDVALIEEVVERSWAYIERGRAEQELRDHDRRKDEFLATLAHELRNPLAPIRAGLEILKRAPTGLEAERARQVMDRQLGHMVRLVDDLLDVSRISRGRLELKRRRIQLSNVIDDAVEASRPFLDAAKHELIMDVAKGPIWLDADLTRLAQVVTNLLDNAAKYTPSGGVIRLSAKTVDGKAVIRVCDNGMGIAASTLPRVFSMFSQGDATLCRAQGGLGIGLSLVQQRVEMHGGGVEAESPGVGQGSTFTVRLPIDEGSAEADGHGDTGGDPVPTRRRVLVVDDNVDGAEMLATLLELAGHETRTAHDGPTALTAAREFAPDVVFLDIGMPGMDGYEVARKLRSDAKLAKVALVALTGWGSADDKRRTTEAGFDFHLTKPVQTGVVDTLLARLTR